MRESLKKSIADSPVRNQERYAKGSIILCNACAAPIFKLDASITLGEPMGRAAQKFVPLNADDLATLALREDIDAGIGAMVRAMTPADARAHLEKLHEVRSGDPALCPICNQCFVQVLAVTEHEVLDRSYTTELLTIPPEGIKAVAIRGRQLGYGPGKSWLHD